VPAYSKLWHSVKVCFRERERDRERSENTRDARPCIDIFRWERLIEIAARIARVVAEKTNPLGIDRFLLLVIYLDVFEVNRIY